MKRFAQKFALLSLVLGVSAGTMVGCGSETKESSATAEATEVAGTETTSEEVAPTGYGTSVIAIGDLNGAFHPFFYTTHYDDIINDAVNAALIGLDREGNFVPGVADFKVEEVTNDAGEAQTIYTFTLKDDIKFSDGEPMTSEDIIFSFLIQLDPTYDGIATMNTLAIAGLEEYTKGDATEIEGLKQIDDKTVQITLDGIDPAAMQKFGIAILPKHYYDAEFVKGDLSKIKEKIDAPMGAGEFIFENFENNVVSLKANPYYYEGAPKLEKLKFQVTDLANLFEAVRTEQVDISEPNASPEMVANVEEAGLHYELVDNLGYGYIGINAERVADLNVRKGLMHLMNRKPAIESYYGDIATIIERPMSRVSWAYPDDAEEYYGYDVAKAKEYFAAAGYADVDGKLMKDGEQLRIEVGIPAGGIMDHPSAPILTQMKSDMEAMGAVLEIADTDGAVFFDVLEQKGWDMWVAAWSSTVDPDMFQVYHSTGPSNHYCIYDDELDKLIVDARLTNDVEIRTGLYQDALDIIMDEAVEMPVYQRKNMYIFNPNMISIDSLPKDMSPFYNFYNELENLEMAQ
ncbi:hypothetical protein AN639_11485 [Candidatus Epulonipiscium fishelsonii]|uniref:Uncharacterized protein n=1 Tax=Candidatus Epulonipiscium fishelsonii TaxID=77094 RepID=A0ACC8X7X9_9FIRM|nr:hypothetical protein AN396_11525 [Epulopiscium sp. SCG-B11WGA-EpuloA1]ONI43070.1 hypothetical protein AN639_11485 [Epulopiscium sp. SCG-B05WGA-EpuloA1]